MVNNIRLGQNALWEAIDESSPENNKITAKDINEKEEIWLMDGVDAKSRK